MWESVLNSCYLVLLQQYFCCDRLWQKSMVEGRKERCTDVTPLLLTGYIAAFNIWKWKNCLPCFWWHLNEPTQQQTWETKELCSHIMLFHHHSVFKTPILLRGWVSAWGKSGGTCLWTWVQRGPIFNLAEVWNTMPGLKSQGCLSPLLPYGLTISL